MDSILRLALLKRVGVNYHKFYHMHYLGNKLVNNLKKLQKQTYFLRILFLLDLRSKLIHLNF
jgi:hypothetical protein